jgi:hypothetical protein
MSTEPTNTSSVEGATAERPERFEPPGITDLASLTDGRAVGEFQSVYPPSAWVQIVLELLYLLLCLFTSFTCLVLIAKYLVLKETDGIVHYLVGDLPSSAPLTLWSTVTLSGACGGCSFSLKWLYHGVAKKRWHRDRIIWRLVAPILSGVLSVFAGFMIISGLVPFLSKASLAGPAAGAAFGFFVGFFSDNVLAGLQKIAYRIFGTVDRPSPNRKPDTTSHDVPDTIGYDSSPSNPRS